MHISDRKNLILGLASNMTLEQIRPFFLSLNKCRYEGDVCLIVNHLSADVYDFLLENDVNLVFFPNPFLKKKYALLTSIGKLFLKKKLKTQFDEMLAVASGHLHCIRHIYYRRVVEEIGQNYSYLMLCDVRDVMFQKDPFDFSIPDGLSVFLEDERHTLGSCNFNAGNIRNGFGEATLQRLKNKPISCAGTIIGTPSAMSLYFDQLVPMLFNYKIGRTSDQSIHNVLLESFQAAPVNVFRNRSGPIFTLHHVDEKDMVFNDKGYLVNESGDVYNTIHQYDRFPSLQKHLHEILMN